MRFPITQLTFIKMIYVISLNRSQEYPCVLNENSSGVLIHSAETSMHALAYLTAWGFSYVIDSIHFFFTGEINKSRQITVLSIHYYG